MQGIYYDTPVNKKKILQHCVVSVSEKQYLYSLAATTKYQKNVYQSTEIYYTKISKKRVKVEISVKNEKIV